MKKIKSISILVILLISSMLILNCENTNENTQEKLDLSNMELEGILDYNTKISKNILKSEFSSKKITSLIDKAYSIAEGENLNSINLKFYFKENTLYVRNDVFTQVDNEGSGTGDSNDCGNWTHCKTCRSEACVTDFIKDMADRYDCFEVRVQRNTFSAKVYGRACSD